MKKTFKRLLLLGLVFAISISSGVVFAEDYANKLSKDFQTHLETMKDTDTAQIAVYATGEITYLTQEEYEKKVVEIMGEENYRFALTGSPQYTEQVNQLIALDRQFQKEAEQSFWNKFMEEVDLKKTDDMVIAGVSVVFSTTKTEILRLATKERVDTILWLKGGPVLPNVTDTNVTYTELSNEVIEINTGKSCIYKYTAVSALHILKVAVGKEVGYLNRVYDVNADGEIDAGDALWALQSAVGKRVVEYSVGDVVPA